MNYRGQNILRMAVVLVTTLFACVLMLPQCSLCPIPVGSCEGRAFINVRVDNDVDPPHSAFVCFGSVTSIRSGDVELDANSLPYRTNDSMSIRGIARYCSQITYVSKRIFNFEFAVMPFEDVYLYAFIDKNNNRQLDDGEWYGVSPANPVTIRCRPGRKTSSVQVVIRRTYRR
jgi:hypothetical protein